MTIITQSFLTRVFFITIISEVLCNNSKVLEKYLKCPFFIFFFPFTQNICFLSQCTICFCGSGLGFLGNGCRSDLDWLCCQLDCSVSGGGTCKCSSEASKQGAIQELCISGLKETTQMAFWGSIWLRGHWFEDSRRQQGIRREPNQRCGQDGWDGGLWRTKVWLQWKV